MVQCVQGRYVCGAGGAATLMEAQYRLSEYVQTSTLDYHFFFKTTKGYLRWNLRCIYLGESIDEPVSKDLILGCFRSFGICVILSNDLVMFCFIIN